MYTVLFVRLNEKSEYILFSADDISKLTVKYLPVVGISPGQFSSVTPLRPEPPPFTDFCTILASVLM